MQLPAIIYHQQQEIAIQLCPEANVLTLKYQLICRTLELKNTSYTILKPKLIFEIPDVM